MLSPSERDYIAGVKEVTSKHRAVLNYNIRQKFIVLLDDLDLVLAHTPSPETMPLAVLMRELREKLNA